MPFLTVNGFELPVLNDSAEYESLEIASGERAFDGTLRKSRVGIKTKLKFSTGWLTASDADAWVNFIRGVGWTWSFEDAHLYSHQGRGPTATTGTGATTSTAFVKFGTRSMVVNTSSSITFGLPLGSIYTAHFWRYTGGIWTHWVIRSDGAKWHQGARNDAASSAGIFAATSTGVTFATNNAHDDIAILPYLVPNAWAPILYAATTPFSALPHMNVSGDALFGQTLVMRGQVRDIRYSAASVSGAWLTNLQSLAIELEEV